jgi:hypothetical protein
MRKICQCLTILIVCLLMIPASITKAKSKNITVEITVGDAVPIVNGIKESPIHYNYIWNKRMMIGSHFFSMIFGIKIEYDGTNDTLTFSNSKTILVMTYNSNIAVVNGTGIAVDVPFTIRSNRSQVPLRFVLETFGAIVTWDPVLHKATIVYEIPEE